MNESDVTGAERVRAMREAFDQSFAAEPPRQAEAMMGYLGLRVGGDAYAIPVRAMTHLSVDQRIVPIPSGSAELLGLAGVRGEIIPVYSLAKVLGYDAAEAQPRWMALCGEGAVLGLAFDTFDGYLQVPESRISRGEGAEAGRRHIQELVRDGEVLRAVVDVGSIVTKLEMNHERDGALERKTKP